MPPTPADSPPLAFRTKLAAMVSISLVFMLTALNISVVGTAMPRIVADLSGYALYPWAASAFLMGNAVLIPITGRLGDLYGRKPFVIAAVIVFTIASAACGLAQTMMQLVVARGAQGVGAGMIIGVVSACIVDLFPDRAQRVRWQVVLSSSFGLAQAIGPSLGGWLAGQAGWRWVFAVNVPVALVALPMAWRFLPHVVHHPEGDRSIDWVGAVYLTLGIGGLLLTAEYSQGHGLFNPTVLGLAAATAVLAVVFFRHQYRTPAPIMPPAVLDDPTARLLMAISVLTGVTMFVLVFYAPLLLQGSFGQSPEQAGLTMTPLLVCITLGSIVNGRLLPRLKRGERLLVWGQAGMCIGCVLLARLDAQTPNAWTMAVFGLCGTSLGFQLPNLTLHIMEVAGRRHAGVASALVQTTRTVGSMIGVGIASVLVNAVYGRQIAVALAKAAVDDAAMTGLLATPQVLVREQDMLALLAAARTHGIAAQPLIDAAREGLARGTHAAFWLCAASALACIALGLRLPPHERTTA